MKSIHHHSTLRRYQKMAILILMSLVSWTLGRTQNVGIGTGFPARELSVNGSVIVDQDSLNYGTFYDPA